MTPPITVAPQGGRLCRRALKEGSALVGVLHLPREFTPVEGAAYVLVESDQGLRLDTTPVSPGLAAELQSYGVGDLLCQPIWNKTTSPRALVVRFIEAFPKDNAWTVYGASTHTMPESAPAHAWFDIQSDGDLKDIPAPFAAAGSGIGQLLTSHPVWPDRQGALYTLPQIQSTWRPHFLDYHRLLVSAARDPEVESNLEATVRQNPVFREISIGRIERDFCAFLASLDDRGMVVLDAPHSAAEYAHRNEVSREVMRQQQDRSGPPRRTPRPA